MDKKLIVTSWTEEVDEKVGILGIDWTTEHTKQSAKQLSDFLVWLRNSKGIALAEVGLTNTEMVTTIEPTTDILMEWIKEWCS